MFQHRGQLIEDRPEAESENPAIAAMNRHKRFSSELIALRHYIQDCGKRIDVLQALFETKPKRVYPKKRTR
jgi:hypothetical protein